MTIELKNQGGHQTEGSEGASEIFDATLPHAPSFAVLSAVANEPFEALLAKPSRLRQFTLRSSALVCLAVVLVAGIVVWGWGFRIEHDVPGFWQVSLAGMLFWLSVTQGMVALSAVLRICHASWRYSLTRLLDMASLFGLWVVALLPFLVVARHRIYALGSSHYNNNVWRVAGSDVWDSFAVGTCYIAGLLLLYFTLLPDYALLRDKAPANSRLAKFAKRMSKVWMFDQRQWAELRRAEGVLVVGVLVSFVASQTILGWDFQLASARDWDSSIFAPLYTLGSLLCGVAMVILVGTVANRLIRGNSLMEPRHYDSLARMLMALGLIWFYFRWCDYLTAWYEKIPTEWAIQGNRIQAFPILAFSMLFGCFVAPLVPNLFKNVRTLPWAQCVIAVCVLSGIAIQRYLDTVPTFAPNYPNSALMPNAGGIFVFIGLAAMFVLTYLVAARFIPVVAWWGRARELTRTGTRQLGNGEVTVMVEDPPLWET